MLSNTPFETLYQSGKQALLRFRLDTAFTDLLQPALANYKDAQNLLSGIIESTTRIRKVKDEHFTGILEKADANNPFAQYIMSQYYSLVQKDSDRQFMYATRSAEQNSAFGIFSLAQCYFQGTGTAKNRSAGLRLSHTAILMDNPAAIRHMAMNCLHGWLVRKNIAMGIRLLKKEAMLGDPQCMIELAEVYREGYFTQKNIEKAKELSAKAISLGHMEGYATLGNIYLYNIYSKKDKIKNHEKAFNYFMKGAGYGEAKSIKSIADCYYYGRFVEENRTKALEWYIRSADAGYSDACYYAGAMYYNGEGTEPDNTLAWKWFSEGHNMENSDCTSMMGTMCFYNDAPGKDINDAIFYFEKVAGSADSDKYIRQEAMLQLYNIYMEGNGTQKNTEKAIQWLKKAAQANNAIALLDYGKILTDKDSPYSNISVGIKYLEKALDKKMHEAALHLAKIYEEGVYVTKDTKKVKDLLYIAAEKNFAEAQYLLGKLINKEAEDALTGSSAGKEAMQWFEKAARNGFEKAGKQLRYEKIKQYEAEYTSYNSEQLCQLAFPAEEYFDDRASEEKMNKYYRLIFLPLTEKIKNKSINPEKNELCLAKDSRTLYSVINSLLDNTIGPINELDKPAVSFHQFKESDFFPYTNSRTLHKIKQNIITAWYALKNAYPEEMSSLSLTMNDDILLDNAEIIRSNACVMGIICIVESRIELEGYLIFNSILFRKIRQALEENTITDLLSDIFNNGYKYIAPNKYLASFWKTHNVKKYINQL